MNKVILIGRLTRDPDIRYSQGDHPIAIARYTLAVDRPRRKYTGDSGQSADFISCVAFDKAAEFAEKYLQKGTKIAISGHIQTGSYTNRDGEMVYTTEVMIEQQEFCESKASAANQQGNLAPVPKPAAGDAGADGFMAIPDNVDDIGLPFN